jgi:ABC-type transport system involved in resistance to organic solvents, periplasmic component
MRNTLETRLGIFAALAVLAGIMIVEILGGFEGFHKNRYVEATFANVQELKPGDRVKMAGVDVGSVSEIGLTNNRVLVRLKVRAAAPVKTDSVATVKFTGLMGQNYISIDFGSPSAPMAENNTLLASVEQTDLGAMMAKLDNVATGVENLTKSFTGEKIDNLLGPFTDFLKANQVPLTATIANIRSISDQISQGKGTVGKLIFEDSLYNSALASVTNIQEVSSDAKLALADARKAINNVNSVIDQTKAGKGTVGLLLTDDALYRETTNSMSNLREILQKVNHGQGTVGKLVNDQEFYKNAKMSLQKLDKATEGLEDQGPLSVIGLVAGSLF